MIAHLQFLKVMGYVCILKRNQQVFVAQNTIEVISWIEWCCSNTIDVSPPFLVEEIRREDA